MDENTAAILRELGEIKSGLTYMQMDMGDIKDELKELKKNSETLSYRISDVERYQSEEEGRRKQTIGLLGVIVTIVSGCISSLIAWFLGGK